MTVFTWDAGDGTSTADWTGPSNWDQKSSYPQAADTAIINAGFDKCYVNSPITCTTVTVAGDAADTVLELQDALTITGDLTITSGKMDTGAGNHALTVGENTKITGDLIGNDSVFSFGDSYYSDVEAGALWIESAGSFTFGDGDVTTSSITAKGSDTFTSAGTGDLIINGRNDNGMYMSHSNNGINISGDVKITTSDGANIDGRGNPTINCGNFIINNSSVIVGFYNADGDNSKTFTVNGNLILTAGIFRTNKTDGNLDDVAIVVTGTTTIGDASASGVDEATFITRESTIDLQGTNGSTPGLEMLAGGTFNGVSNANHTIGSVEALTTTYNSKIYLTSGTTTIYQEMGSNMTWKTYSNGDVNIYHGNGTVKFTAPTYAYLYNNAVKAGDNSFYNVIIDHAGAAGQRIALSGDVNFSVMNDLTVSDGDFYIGGAGLTYVGNDCMVDNGDTHVFNTSGAFNRPFTVLGEFTLGVDSTYIAGEEPNTFGCITISGGATMNLTSGVTLLTGNVGSTNQDDYNWTPIYARGTFNPNSGTFINASDMGYIGYKKTSEGLYGEYLPFYNYIIDFDGGASSHVQNNRMRVLNDFTLSGAASEGSYGVYGLRNESDYDTIVNGNMHLVSSGGYGAAHLSNMTNIRIDGNITIGSNSLFLMPTSSAGGFTIGGSLFNYGTIGQAEDSP